MFRRFQVTLHGCGFSVPIEDGEHIRGFYAIRRILADTAQAAENKAIAELRSEEKFRALVDSTQRETGTSSEILVRLENIQEVTWFKWHFSRQHANFIFYSD